MKYNYRKSHSTIKPDLVDTTSSKYTVYIRQNIVEKTEMDFETNEPITFYEYDELKLTREEYQEYLNELSIIDIQQQRADIDYILLMTGLSEV